VHPALAYSTIVVTLGLVVTRPRVTGHIRVTPAIAASAGAAALALLGVVHLDDVIDAFRDLAKPLWAVGAMLVVTAVAERTRVIEAMAARTLGRGTRSAGKSFALVFVTGVVVSALLNNDACVLLLTPMVIAFVSRTYPGQPNALPPFVFAVFASAGVAPLLISNPMNMVVAAYAKIGFAEYATVMIPVSVASAAATFVALRLHFRKELSACGEPSGPAVTDAAGDDVALTGGRRAIAVVLAATIAAFPLATAYGVPLWAVATFGAIAALAVERLSFPRAAKGADRPVSLDLLPFVFAVFLIAKGLANLGVTDHLARAYASKSVWTLGTLSALGAEAFNNHPMAILNVLALERVEGAGSREVLATLVGGDLGPRLLPMGSLAGLLWLESLRRAAIPVSAWQFVRTGIATAVPSIVVALGVLWLL
jgi:arsenical pump membrane protein